MRYRQLANEPAAQRRRRRTAGQALAEFAMIIPLLLAAVFGALDIGRVVWAADVVANAAREGARWASVRGDSSVTTAADKDAIRAHTRQYLIAGGTSQVITVCYSTVRFAQNSMGCSGDVNEPGADNSRGALVTVTVTTTVQVLTGSLVGLPTHTVSGSSTVLVNN
ncbi:hypothetical protein BH23CHL7_BH23CHL7_06310 [soil metagenome]